MDELVAPDPRLLEKLGRKFKAGDVLFKEGEAGNEAFLIQEGRVRLLKKVRTVERSLMVLKPGDLFVLTADHGNDPTWRGTDHTRERIPVIGIAPGLKGGGIGLRPTFCDIGETVAEHLGIAPGRHGTSFLSALGGPAGNHA